MGSGSQASLELVVALKDQASKGLGDIGDKGGFLKNALSFATGGLIEKGIESIGGSLTGFFGDAISESRGWNDAMGQTDAVIKSTGGSAGVTRQQVEDLANSLSANNGLSKFADDAVASGENLLLTFTGIGKDVFPQATQTMLDMSQAMGGDMKGTAIQLGKALNDPAQGLSALTRVGVTFTEQQKEQIKAMVKAGDTAGAQKVMLAELSREFGGSAKAAADAAGPMVKIGAAFDNIKQTVGDALLPILNKLMGAFAGLLTGALPAIQAVTSTIGVLFDYIAGGEEPTDAAVAAFSKLPGPLQFLGNILSTIGISIGAFFFQLSQGKTFAESLGIALTGIIPNAQGITSVLTEIGNGVQALFTAFQGNGQPLLDFFNSMGPAMGAVGTFIVNLISNFQAFFATIGQGGDVLGAFATLIGSNFGAVTNLIGGLLGQLGAALPGILAKLGEWGEAFVNWIGPKIPPMLAKLAEFAGALLGWIFGTALPAIIEKLGEWGKAFVDWVGPKIPPLLQKLGELAVKVWEWITGTALPTLIQKLGEWAKAFVDWVGPKIGPLLGELGKLLLQVGGWILGTALPTIIGKLLEWGGAFISWVAPKIPPLLVELGKLLLQLGGWLITTALPAIVSKLTEWAGAFLGWIAKDVLPTLPAKLGEIATAIWGFITTTAKEVVGKAAAIGKSIIDGILSGLGNIAQKLFDMVVAAFGDAIQMIKNFIQGKSPSLLFAVEIGDPIGQGIILGAQRSLMPLAQTMITSINQAVSQVQTHWGTISKRFSDKGIGDLPPVGGSGGGGGGGAIPGLPGYKWPRPGSGGRTGGSSGHGAFASLLDDFNATTVQIASQGVQFADTMQTQFAGLTDKTKDDSLTHKFNSDFLDSVFQHTQVALAKLRYEQFEEFFNWLSSEMSSRLHEWTQDWTDMSAAIMQSTKAMVDYILAQYARLPASLPGTGAPVSVLPSPGGSGGGGRGVGVRGVSGNGGEDIHVHVYVDGKEISGSLYQRQSGRRRGS